MVISIRIALNVSLFPYVLCVGKPGNSLLCVPSSQTRIIFPAFAQSGDFAA